MEVININISKQELDRRRERMEKLRNFEKPDRVPVMPSIDSRYYYPKIGISLKATFDFIHNGLHGKEIRFREKMLQLAKNYKVRLSDEGEFCPMEENMKLCADTDGPFILAAEVRGFEQIYYDIYERPAFLKSLLETITEKEIQWIEFARKENNDENGILRGVMKSFYPFPSLTWLGCLDFDNIECV